MKKLPIIMLAMIFITACENSEVKINTEKLDQAGSDLQKKVEKGADTIVSKVSAWKDSIDKDDDTAR